MHMSSPGGTGLLGGWVQVIKAAVAAGSNNQNIGRGVKPLMWV